MPSLKSVRKRKERISAAVFSGIEEISKKEEPNDQKKTGRGRAPNHIGVIEPSEILLAS